MVVAVGVVERHQGQTLALARSTALYGALYGVDRPAHPIAHAGVSCAACCARPPPIPPVPRREYAAFRVSSDGELQGVGMLIANEPVNGHLLVLAPIKGGPADRAGVLPGDELTSINGMSMEVRRGCGRAGCVADEVRVAGKASLKWLQANSK